MRTIDRTVAAAGLALLGARDAGLREGPHPGRGRAEARGHGHHRRRPRRALPRPEPQPGAAQHRPDGVRAVRERQPAGAGFDSKGLPLEGFGEGKVQSRVDVNFLALPGAVKDVLHRTR